MATQVQIRRGTTAEHGTFTGAVGELTVDTDKDVVVVHDGATAGGRPMLRENGSQNFVTTGTATAASFIPTSSTVPTNGVYLPAANSVALATNGQGRLFIDGSNIRVPNGNFFSSSDNTGLLALYGGGAFNAGAGIVVYGTSHASSADVIRFSRGAFSESMRLDSQGRLGVGTSSPQKALEVAGAIRISSDSSGLFELGRFSSAYGGAAISCLDSNFLRFQFAGTDRMTLTSGGSLGIGDTGPDSTLTIKAAASTTPLRVSGPSSEFMRCDSSGRLLVGTSSDSGGALLQVNGDRIRVGTAKTPASATATGTTGEICWDASYIYVCTATNTWKRAALSTW